MELAVTQKKENPLLGRQELELEISYQGATPSSADVKKAVAQEFKSDEGAVIIRHVYTGFGVMKVKVIAAVYKDAAGLAQVETIKKKPKKKAEPVAEAKK